MIPQPIPLPIVIPRALEWRKAVDSAKAIKFASLSQYTGLSRLSGSSKLGFTSVKKGRLGFTPMIFDDWMSRVPGAPMPMAMMFSMPST